VAQKKKPDPKESLKNKMKKQVNAINEKADIFSGKKDKIGKYDTTKKKLGKKLGKEEAKAVGKEEATDLDKFFRSVEEGFRDIKVVAKEDKKPYDGLLGRVEVERLTKTINK
jgi:hypothetical protein